MLRPLELILVDARHGLVEQSRRHAFLASLLGVPHLVLCVNKMDLVDYDEAVFEHIKGEFRDWIIGSVHGWAARPRNRAERHGQECRRRAPWWDRRKTGSKP